MAQTTTEVSDVTTFLRAQSPALADQDDETLTRFAVETYPQLIAKDPQFKADAAKMGYPGEMPRLPEEYAKNPEAVRRHVEASNRWNAIVGGFTEPAEDRTPEPGFFGTLKEGWQDTQEDVEGTVMNLPARLVRAIPRPSAKTVQDAFNVLGNIGMTTGSGFSPGYLNPEMSRLAQEGMAAPSTPPGKAAEVVAGATKSALTGVEGLVSPIGIATMAAPPGWIGRLVAMGFTADMLSHAKEQAVAFGEASVTGNTEQQTEALGNLLLTGLFSTTAGKHAFTPQKVAMAKTLAKELLSAEPMVEPKPVTPEVRIAEANNLPATAEVLRDLDFATRTVRDEVTGEPKNITGGEPLAEPTAPAPEISVKEPEVIPPKPETGVAEPAPVPPAEPTPPGAPYTAQEHIAKLFGKGVLDEPTPPGAASVAPVAKEPWQMSQPEAIAYYNDGAQLKPTSVGGRAAITRHVANIKIALEQGKEVPPEVLAEYPEIANAPQTPISRPTGGTADRPVQAAVESPEVVPEKPAQPLNISRVTDELRAYLKRNPVMGKLDAEAKREWLREFGIPSHDTNRKLRYTYKLSDGRVVSAEGALKFTNPKAYERLKSLHANLATANARADIFKALPEDVQRQMIDDIPLDEVAAQPGFKNDPAGAVGKYLEKEGHLLGGAALYKAGVAQELHGKVMDLALAEESKFTNGPEAARAWRVANKVDDALSVLTKDGKFLATRKDSAKDVLLRKYGWTDAYEQKPTATTAPPPTKTEPISSKSVVPPTFTKGERVITSDYGPGVVESVLPNRILVLPDSGGKAIGVNPKRVQRVEAQAPATSIDRPKSAGHVAFVESAPGLGGRTEVTEYYIKGRTLHWMNAQRPVGKTGVRKSSYTADLKDGKIKSTGETVQDFIARQKKQSDAFMEAANAQIREFGRQAEERAEQQRKQWEAQSKGAETPQSRATPPSTAQAKMQEEVGEGKAKEAPASQPTETIPDINSLAEIPYGRRQIDRAGNIRARDRWMQQNLQNFEAQWGDEPGIGVVKVTPSFRDFDRLTRSSIERGGDIETLFVTKDGRFVAFDTHNPEIIREIPHNHPGIKIDERKVKDYGVTMPGAKPEGGSELSIDFEAPNGERRTISFEKRSFKELSPDLQEQVRREHRTTMRYPAEQKQFEQWDSILKGNKKVTLTRIQDARGENYSSERISLDSPEVEAAAWVRRGDLHDVKLSPKAQQLKERLESEQATKESAEAQRKEQERVQLEARLAAQREYHEAIAATPMPKGKKGSIEVAATKGESKIKLEGTQYGDWFINKVKGDRYTPDKYKVTHVPSGLGVSAEGLRSLEEAKNFIKALNHSKLRTNWTKASDLSKEEMAGFLEIAKHWVMAENVPSYFKSAKPSEQSGVASGEQQVPQSLGGQNPADVLEIPKSQLSQLTDAVRSLAESGERTEPAKAFDLGESLAGAKESIKGAVEGLKAAGTYLKTRLEGKPVVTHWNRILGDRHLALTESALNARKWMKNVLKAMPDPKLREAISDWVDTGGDDALLARAASETKEQYKAGYERARNLTPDEKTVAENLRNYFESRLQEAIDAGILEDGIENYIHRRYEGESKWKKGVIAELRSGIFTGKPSLAKQRVFEYDFEAEKAGKKPVKDFAKRVVAYDLALNKAIADRAAIKAMMETKMPDGRPMIDVGGGGKVIEGPTGETDATLINRSARKIDPDDAKANRGDYKAYDHPALRKWKWVAEDANGKPIFVQGDVLVHPEAIGQIRVLFDRSRIRENPVGRVALNLSSTVKQTMLDLSGFHQVQIGVHGMEHKTFKPVKEIDFTNPDVRGLIRGGAAVGETTGMEMFSEGLAGSSLTKHIPWAGERIQAYQHWLFGDYIPRLKMAMGLHALDRNRSRFKNLNDEQLYQMTADQMNAAFGELNYEMMGRSKTMQDALRLTLLAPDFLEARSRFVAQAFTKFGSEQRNALILGAATMYITARIINKLLNDEYHFEPKNAFNIVHNGRSYGLRTVQGDLVHAITEPGKFTNHRLNPVYGKPALEFLTGRDYFGRKRDVGDKAKDLATTIVPISMRGPFTGGEQTLMESFLNAFGFVTKRDSPSSDMSELAKSWKDKNNIKDAPGEFIYDAEKDPYRKIKLAAERGDVASVRSEIGEAMKAGLKRNQIIEHFNKSEKHLFAGSRKNEDKFVSSLTTDQKKIYNDAREERKRINAIVRQAFN